jgi:ribonuclease BN (tRNA processing enzyme)
MVRVTMLGSGDAFGSGGRLNSAYLIEAPDVTFLVDAGPTVLQGLKAAGRDTTAVDFVLLTHLHGDHFGGVPFLFMEWRWCHPRTRPFLVCGPPTVERRVQTLFAALYEQSAAEGTSFPVKYEELRPGRAHTIGKVRVLPIQVPHAPELLCLGFRVEVAGKTLLFSGDTTWCDALMRHARGADLFLCDCSNYETRTFHLSYPEIAAHASELGCKRLVLTHLGQETLDRLSELNLECGRDGLTIEL